MTPLQIAWLNANTAFTPLCQCAYGWGFTNLQSIDVNSVATAGSTIVLPELGPLSGCENTSAVVVGKLVKLDT